MDWAPDACIVGVGETEFYKRGECEKSEFELACEAIKKAVDDAGLELDEIDGFSTYMNERWSPTALATALGISELKYGSIGWMGGNSSGFPVMSSALAVHAGAADYMVAFRAIAQGQHGRYGQAADLTSVSGDDAHTRPYGLETPPQIFALLAQRYLHEHNVSEDQLGHVAINSRYHGVNNPNAVFNEEELTMSEYLDSRMISYPYRLYDCTPENDGACAVVVTSTEQAHSVDATPAHIKAAAQGSSQRYGTCMNNAMPLDDYSTGFGQEAASQLYERADIEPSDVDVAQLYENFTGQVLQATEDYGFASRGEAVSLFANGETKAPHGKIPINTAGGHLSEAYIHGFNHVVEGVRQVRGTSVNQVENVENSLVAPAPGVQALQSSLLLSPI